MTTKTKSKSKSTKQQLDECIDNGEEERFAQIFKDENYYENAAHICYNLVENALLSGQYDIAQFIFEYTDIDKKGPHKDHYSTLRFAKYVIDHAGLETIDEIHIQFPDMFTLRKLTSYCANQINNEDQPNKTRYYRVLDYLLSLAHEGQEKDGLEAYQLNVTEKSVDRIVQRTLKKLPADSAYKQLLVARHGIKKRHMPLKKSGTSKFTVGGYFDEANPPGDNEAANQELADSLAHRGITSFSRHTACIFKLAPYNAQILLGHQEKDSTLAKSFADQLPAPAIQEAVFKAFGKLNTQQKKKFARDLAGVAHNENWFGEKILMNHNVYQCVHKLIEQAPDTSLDLALVLSNSNQQTVNIDQEQILTNLQRQSTVRKKLKDDLVNHCPIKDQNIIQLAVKLSNHDIINADDINFDKTADFNLGIAKLLLESEEFDFFLTNCLSELENDNLEMFVRALGLVSIDDDRARDAIDHIVQNKNRSLSGSVLADVCINLIYRQRNKLFNRLKPIIEPRAGRIFIKAADNPQATPPILARFADAMGIKGDDFDDEQKEEMLKEIADGDNAPYFEGVMRIIKQKFAINFDEHGVDVYRSLKTNDDKLNLDPGFKQNALDWYDDHLSASTKAAVDL